MGRRAKAPSPTKPRDASPQATQTRCLQVPLQRGRNGRKERLQQEEARRSRTQRAKPPRDQAHAVPQVPRLRERALLVELVLLLFDQRGHRLPPEVPQPPSRRCASNPQE